MCSCYFFFSSLEHHYQLVIHQNIKAPSKTTALACRRNDSDNICLLVLFTLWIIHANQRLLYLSKILWLYQTGKNHKCFTVFMLFFLFIIGTPLSISDPSKHKGAIKNHCFSLSQKWFWQYLLASFVHVVDNSYQSEALISLEDPLIISNGKES